MKQPVFPTVPVVFAIIGLPGCQQLLGGDFEKATMVGELRLGSSEKFERTVTLPSGNARLTLAVPNYRCAPVDDGPIAFVVRGPEGIEFSERLFLSQLTWSYGKKSCDAIGYLEAGSREGSLAPGMGEMRLEINRDQERVTIEIDSSQVSTSSGRTASVWIIYGDRVPSTRIFGPLGAKE